jgi:hypothetical protein
MPRPSVGAPGCPAISAASGGTASSSGQWRVRRRRRASVTLNRQLVGPHLDLIQRPVPAADLGIEDIYERRKTEGGQRGSLERGQVSAKFRF